ERNYNIRFSYVREDVEGINIIVPQIDTNSIDLILPYLRKNTPFIYNRINERYITIISNSNKQKLCGRVIDFNTQLPLEGANIIFEDVNYSTVSDAEGYFYISEEVENTRFTVSYIGYSPFLKNTSQLSEKCSNILLMPSILPLETVTVQNIFTQGIHKN